MAFKKLLISGLLSIGILASVSQFVYAQDISYKIQSGDTFWKISQKYGVSITSLMKANNATESTILYPGQIITIPGISQTIHVVQSGDSYWSISRKYGVDFNKLLQTNNANLSSMLNIGDKVIIPAVNTESRPVQTTQPVQSVPVQPGTVSEPSITYLSYTVQKGDYPWLIAQKYGIPVNELLSANNMNSSSILYIGMQIKIPVHNIPVKETPGEQYGELLDWWTEVQYVIPLGSSFEVVDFYTGKSFFVKRTLGANHADCETLTVQDTNIMKEIWGGSFSWVRRPVLIKFNGRKIAASMTSMPHAGNDSAAGGAWTSWRSDNYGSGTNFDYVKGNGIDGHFDIHFLNSTRHKDGLIDPEHQKNIKIAAGLN